MSDLEDLCEALGAINGEILQVSQQLHVKAQSLNRAAASAADASRSAEGGGAALAQVASAFTAAARHCGHAATALVGAGREGQAYIQRTVGGGQAGANSATVSRADGVDVALTDADRRALADYTGQGYAEMNPALRGDSADTAALLTRADAVSQALHRMPSHTGIVYRGLTLSASQLLNYEVGARVSHSAFTSASTDAGSQFAGNTSMRIFSKNGKSVSAFSEYKSENEVLFDKGSRFFVRGHTIDSVTGRHVILLEEV